MISSSEKNDSRLQPARIKFKLLHEIVAKNKISAGKNEAKDAWFQGLYTGNISSLLKEVYKGRD